jgi:mannitol-1-phosphate 5-dehydrogenase
MANSQASGKKAVHFGAGMIGRGFVACFLRQSGYEVVFVDVTQANVDRLNNTKSYKVTEVGAEGTSTSVIDNYRAINSRTHEAEVVGEIATADVVTCSVGPNVLQFLAPVIAKGIDARSSALKPLAVIACENKINATSALEEFIKLPKNTAPERLDDYESRARFANCAIDRIVPAQDADAGLDVKLEKFFEWVVDRSPFADVGVPPIEGIHWVDNLAPFIERKLFTVNTAHATAAYMGFNRRKRTVFDALQDKDINAQVRAAVAETASLITKKHGIDVAAQDAYVQKILKRIGNPFLLDAVERVGRAPLRKLSRKERFIAPASELAEAGMKCDALVAAAEMGFRFQNVDGDEESVELANIMAGDSTDEDVVKQVCGLTEQEKLFPRMVEVVSRVRADLRDD